VSGIPGLDGLDLAGIVAVVVIDSDAVNANFGQGGEDDGFVEVGILGAAATGSSSVRKAGRSVDAMSVSLSSTIDLGLTGIRGSAVDCTVRIGDAGRQPRCGMTARRLFKTDAG
jgi:hypothetical protein